MAASSGSSVIHSGMLGVKTETLFRRTFLQRFVLLRADDIEWFADAAHKERVGFAPLAGATLSLSPQDAGAGAGVGPSAAGKVATRHKHPYYMELVFSGEHYLPLAAASNDELLTWIKVRATSVPSTASAPTACWLRAAS